MIPFSKVFGVTCPSLKCFKVSAKCSKVVSTRTYFQHFFHFVLSSRHFINNQISLRAEYKYMILLQSGVYQRKVKVCTPLLFGIMAPSSSDSKFVVLTCSPPVSKRYVRAPVGLTKSRLREGAQTGEGQGQYGWANKDEEPD